MYVKDLVCPSDFLNCKGLPGMSTSLSARKIKAHYIESKCPKCYCQICIGKCPSLGYVSMNRKDKIKF